MSEAMRIGFQDIGFQDARFALQAHNAQSF